MWEGIRQEKTGAARVREGKRVAKAGKIPSREHVGRSQAGENRSREGKGGYKGSQSRKNTLAGAGALSRNVRKHYHGYQKRKLLEKCGNPELGKMIVFICWKWYTKM